MPNIIFRYQNGAQISTKAADGERLMDAARRVGIAVDAPCNGSGLCGKCRMRLLSGTVESVRGRHISDQAYLNGWRLSCETYVHEDIVVEVPEAASAFQNGIRTADLSDLKTRKVFDDVRDALISSNVPVFDCIITLDKPTMDDTRPDTDRLCDALEEMLGIRPSLSLTALRKLPDLLRNHDFSVRAVLSDENRIIDLLSPEDESHLLGAAVDIGTTTVSAVLVDLKNGEPVAQASSGNGQIIYGADVINRIIESARDGGKERLQRAIIYDTIMPLLETVCTKVGESVKQIYRVTVAGNTTMEHLLLGMDASPIRMEPYIPTFFSLESLRAAEVFPDLNPEAKLILTPNVGSYVGGDITAGVYAADMCNTDAVTLFVDLGTNGELVIGNRDYLMTCACSAGPAFEGGDISCGMRATDGAVEAADVDRETMEPDLRVIGPSGQKPCGLCGSGLIDLTAALFKAGIISPKGKFVRCGRRVLFDEHGMGRYVFAFPEEAAEGRELSLNEVDIDNLIRAKGAIFSAICLMLGQLGMETGDLDEIIIAGGIGGGINFHSAVTIGMLPDISEDRFRYKGNTSLSGAYAALMSEEAAAKIREIGSNMIYVELSSEPGYMDEFVGACFLPHTNRALFPNVG